jgi:RimJ/RimL family protein N-acetyltransferase
MTSTPSASGPRDVQATEGRFAIPRLVTARLLLRAFVADDLDPYAAMNADPEMSRYTGGTIDRTATWRLMAMLLGHWDLRGYGMWAMVERATGRFIGRAGLYNQEGWPGLEVAWTVARDRWGNGYATEAGEAALNHAFTELGADHVISVIHPENARSIAVAKKLGETPESTTELNGEPRVIYGISARTWRARRSTPAAQQSQRT